MSRTLKWILAILVVLVILAIAAGAIWLWQYRAQMMASYRVSPVQPNAQATPGVPNFPNDPRGFGFGNRGRNHMFGYDDGFAGPMMGRGMGRMMRFWPFGMGFLFLGGLVRWFLPILVLVAVAVIFYLLGRRSRVVRAEPAATAPPPAEQNP